MQFEDMKNFAVTYNSGVKMSYNAGSDIEIDILPAIVKGCIESLSSEERGVINVQFANGEQYPISINRASDVSKVLEDIELANKMNNALSSPSSVERRRQWDEATSNTEGVTKFVLAGNTYVPALVEEAIEAARANLECGSDNKVVIVFRKEHPMTIPITADSNSEEIADLVQAANTQKDVDSFFEGKNQGQEQAVNPGSWVNRALHNPATSRSK
jgi:hypothetical protein